MNCNVLIPIFLLTAVVAFAQTESARISGRVTDPTDAVIVGAECRVTNIETNISTSTTTNEDGIYVLFDLHPATYRLTIRKEGFRTVFQPSLQLYVQDAVNENFRLALESVSQTSTVVATEPLLQTVSAAVSTVVDDKFVHNMPLNGRSFQSLIALTPGVVFVSADIGAGQFGVNGQRSNANYFMVDGVSANFGSSGNGLGQYISGSTPALSSGGGTNALISVDAMQEFRIQTSSYAPEFGRSNGAQISIVTKSGTNEFHGTAYDYLRNDVFDARNWFNRPPDPKPPLRQNDFGGTLGGTLWKNRTFFFFSYEGLRLLQPQTSTGLFYTESARAAVAPVYAPFVNAFPVPTTPPIDPTCDNLTHPCLAPLTVAYSNPATVDATSIRLDHHLSRITLFGRYNHSPTHDTFRQWEELSNDYANTDTVTVGAAYTVASDKLNDFRANWSRNTGTTIYTITNFHRGVAPPDSVVFPSSTPFRFDTSQAHFYPPDGAMDFRDGTIAALSEKQLNFVDTFSWTAGSHQLKFGADYRRINADTRGNESIWSAGPPAFSFIVAGTLPSTFVLSVDPISVNTNNYSFFGQDTWRATNDLTVTYGLRWEINTPPQSATAGKPLYIVQGVFDSKPLVVVPGVPWTTKLGNLAPRLGVAYQVTRKTVVRGGLGLFYDLGYGNTGSLFSGGFPYVRLAFRNGPVPFDLTNPIFQPVPFSTTIGAGEIITAADPNLRLPFTTQWNAAIEREIGPHQALTATYLGSDGMRVPRQDSILPPAFLSGGGEILATHNAGNSRYNSFQAQFQRRFSRGLQALASYTLSKSTDVGSSDHSGVTAPSVSQIVLPPLTPSDFDIRHTFAGAVSYEIPASYGGGVTHAIMKGWGVDGLVRVSSAWPVNVIVGAVSPAFGPYSTQPDIVPGQPFWLAAPGQPGGKVLNPAAFTPPPVGQTGNSPRNGLRVPFSINQTDLALWRRFDLTERVKLQIRAEYFNVFNHPMFNAPGQNSDANYWGTAGNPNPYFGRLGTDTTNNALSGATGGGQSPQYAVGGPRSGQFTLKLMF